MTLKALRESVGPTIQVAKKAGLSREEVWRIETGRVFPGTETALRLAETLGITVSQLMDLCRKAKAERSAVVR